MDGDAVTDVTLRGTIMPALIRGFAIRPSGMTGPVPAVQRGVGTPLFEPEMTMIDVAPGASKTVRLAEEDEGVPLRTGTDATMASFTMSYGLTSQERGLQRRMKMNAMWMDGLGRPKAILAAVLTVELTLGGGDPCTEPRGQDAPCTPFP